jgi:hypothetical protein
MERPPYSDRDIVKALARIQHEHGWDFGIAPKGATLEDMLAHCKRLRDAFPELSAQQLVRYLLEANDHNATRG